MDLTSQSNTTTKVEKLTIEILKALEHGDIIDHGVGIIHAVADHEVKWVACKGLGPINDWAIYYGHPYWDKKHIKLHGIKIRDRIIARELMPCDDEVLKKYRLH